MDDRDVLLIEHYIYESFSHPFSNKEDSYARWAADEILDRVIFEAMKLPAHITGLDSLTLEEVVEEFITQMDYYAYIATHDEGRTVFSVAREEAKLILCYIHSYK